MALYRRELERKFKESETWYGQRFGVLEKRSFLLIRWVPFKFMNAAAENLTGWKLNEAVGKDC